MDSEQAARRADRARMILDNELFAEAMSALDESLKRQRLKVKPTDIDGQTKLILAEQIRHQIEGYLRRVIQDAQVAEMQLIQQQRRSIFAR